MSEVIGPVRETDAFALRMERDPLLRSTITAVLVLDRVPVWERLVERVERATRLAPTFRARLEPSPLPGAAPRWVLDPDFDPRWHLRRVAAPSPHTLDTVLELARVVAMAAFDPARPLWELTLVEGLEGGQAALLLKVHHSLTDGVGGIALASHVVDTRRRPADLGPLPPLPEPGPDRGLAGALATGLDRWACAAAAAAAEAPTVVGRAVRDPLGAARATARAIGSLARFARPVVATRSPIMTERRLRWDLQRLDVPLEQLRAAGRVAGGTLNDAFLAAVTGGLRRYHEHHGSGVASLRITMPINVRQPEDPIAGNRITLVRFDVPVAEPDPVRRMREIGAQADAWRREPALGWSQAVAGALNLLPVPVTAGMLRHVDLLASNVPGFSKPVYVGGARVDAFYAFGPTVGSAANLTLMSYRQTCHLGITTDQGAVPDPAVFLDCVRAGFEEVLALAERATRPG